MSALSLPPDFVARIPRVYGDRGRAWLEALPERLTQCRAQWGLTDFEPCPGLSLNYLEFARRGDEPVALKVLRADLEGAGSLAVHGNTVRRTDYTPTLTPDQDRATGRILEELDSAGLAAPNAQELAPDLRNRPDLEDLLHYLVRRQDLL